jgi:serine/threonine protein kinase
LKERRAARGPAALLSSALLRPMPAPPHESAPFSREPGDAFRLGPFQLVRPLGRGGFAPVWLAEEVYDGRKLRDVALKLFILPEGITSGSEEAARWRDGIVDEARALCRVEHPSVVRLYSLQQDEARGAVGLAMEYVAGENLDARLRAHGPFARRQALDVGVSVA